MADIVDTAIPTLKLGKLPAKPVPKAAKKFKLDNLMIKWPLIPRHFGEYRRVRDWGMLGNDQYGNCLAEGTLVSAPDIEGAFKMPYIGPVITFLLASGKRLTVTSKHSLLTREGFASADTIKEGDYLVGARGTEVLPGTPVGGRQRYVDNRPTPVDEIFSTLSVSDVARRKVVPRSVDFHGDEKFFNGNVDVVRANGFLRNEAHAVLRKPEAQNQVSSASQLKSVFEGAGAAFLAGLRRFLSAHGYVGPGGYGPAFAYAHSRVAQPKRLSLRAKRVAGFTDGLLQKFARNASGLAGILERSAGHVHSDRLVDIAVSALRGGPTNLAVRPQRPVAGLHHPSPECRRTDANFFRDLGDAFPNLVETDCVVGIYVQRNVRTHVYDLSTTSRWYLAGGIVSHNCVWAGAAHEHMMTTATSEECVDAIFSTENVLSDYSAVTKFNPKDPDSDQGTDMREAADYRRNTGIIDSTGTRHKIEAHLWIDPKDTRKLAMATYLFDIVGLGVEWPASATQQFDDHLPFSVTAGKARIEGGHYMPVIGRNSKGHFLLVTWGRLQAATPEWVKKYADECYIYLTRENRTAGKTPEGFDDAKLTEYLRAL